MSYGCSSKKRIFDFTMGLMAFICMIPFFIAIAILIKITSRGPVFYRQERMGRHLEPFWIFKFRTMVKNADKLGLTISQGKDKRITRIGHFLRKYKLDELPQVINIIKGEMSIVGPRPLVSDYLTLYRNEYEHVLQVRPGLTGIASLKFRNEAAMLVNVDNVENLYIKKIIPMKLAFERDYIKNCSLRMDLSIIFQTAWLVWHPIKNQKTTMSL